MYLVVVANYSKEIILIRHNINALDIIYKYETDPSRYVSIEKIDYAVIGGQPIFFVYKNEKELGFVRMDISNELFGVRRYLLISKYVIDIENGKATIMQKDRISRSRIAINDYGKNAKEHNVKLRSFYSYSYFANGRIVGGNELQVYMGIKHEYDAEMVENVTYKFIEYFDDIFDGIYIYFFVSYEKLYLDKFDFSL